MIEFIINIFIIKIFIFSGKILIFSSTNTYIIIKNININISVQVYNMTSNHTDTQIIENTNLDKILEICNPTPFKLDDDNILYY